MKALLKKLLTIYLCVTGLAAIILIAISLIIGVAEGQFRLSILALGFSLGIALILFGIFFMIGVGIVVYHDAEKRGMPGLLWALVAALVPYFLGIIAYLVVRQQVQRLCPSCRATTQGETSFCSSCGHALSASCPSCSGRVDSGASFCPHCGAALKAP